MWYWLQFKRRHMSALQSFLAIFILPIILFLTTILIFLYCVLSWLGFSKGPDVLHYILDPVIPDILCMASESSLCMQEKSLRNQALIMIAGGQKIPTELIRMIASY